MIPGRFKNISALLILFIYHVLVYGQKVQVVENSVDSLKTLLATKNGVDRLDLLSGLFDHYKGSEYKVALSYAVEFENLAKKYGDSVRIVEGGRKIAYSLMDLGRNMEAIGVLKQALSIAERNKESLPGMKKHIKFILNNAGIAQTDVGNYDVALDLLMRSLAIRQEEGDKKSLASGFNNIGRVYHELRNHTEAIKYYKQALEVKRELGDKNALERILINLGLSHDNILEHEKAISYFNQALDVCGGQCSDETKKELYLATGRSHLLVHKLATAEEYLLKALAVSRKQNSPSYIINCLYQLSSVEDERGNIEKRKRYLEQALALAESVDLVDLNIQINAEMANLYGEIKDRHKQAYYLSKYTKLQDSIYSIDLIKKLSKVETDFTDRDNIKALNSKNETLGAKLELIKCNTPHF